MDLINYDIKNESNKELHTNMKRMKEIFRNPRFLVGNIIIKYKNKMEAGSVNNTLNNLSMDTNFKCNSVLFIQRLSDEKKLR